MASGKCEQLPSPAITSVARHMSLSIRNGTSSERRDAVWRLACTRNTETLWQYLELKYWGKASPDE